MGNNLSAANKSVTYDDFMSAAQRSGLLEKFSDYDLQTAKKFPEFGLGILSYKQDYANASTDEQRALANAGANELRALYGSYTGGGDGSEYYATGPEFEYGGKAPEYTDTYGEAGGRLLDGMMNYKPFAYDPETDAVYGAARKMYIREGERAAESAIAKTAAKTGGIPSSYSVTAASQAEDYYLTKLSDAYNERYAQAYKEWRDRFDMMSESLGAASKLQQNELQRYLDEYDNYQEERKAAYGEYSDRFDRLEDKRSAEAKVQSERVQNALDLWKLYGYATEPVSAALGVPVGTPTSDRSYKDWQIAIKTK